MSDLFTDGQPEKKTRAKKEKAEVIDINESGPVESQGTELAVISASTDVIVLDPEISTETLLPAVIFKEGGSVDVLAKLREKLLAVPTDISTPKGRQAIKSLCYKISRSKTALDDSGKELGDKLRAMLNPILEERRKLREGCDQLAVEVRKPLTDWEDSEDKRITAHEVALVEISNLASFDEDPSSEQVKARLEQLNSMPERDWQEFIQRAVEAKKSARAALENDLQSATAAEEAATEIARMEAEAAAAETERLRLEREAELAAAAEAARVEAERLAAAEAERVAEVNRLEAARVAEAAEQERQRIEDQRIAAEEVAAATQRRLDEAQHEAEEKRKADHRQALVDIVTFATRACSEFNSSAVVADMQEEFERHSVINRDFQEFQPEADEMIAKCKRRITERLKEAKQEEADRKAQADQAAADEAERQRKAATDEANRRRDEALEKERQAAEQRANDKKRRAQTREEIAGALRKECDLLDIEASEQVADALMAGKIPHTQVIF